MRDVCQFVTVNRDLAKTVLVDNEVYWITFYVEKCEQATTETLKRPVASGTPFWLVLNRPLEWKWPSGAAMPGSEVFHFGPIWVSYYAARDKALPANFFERVKPVANPDFARTLYEKYLKAGLPTKGEDVALNLCRSIPNRFDRAAALMWWSSQVVSRRPTEAYALSRQTIAMEPSNFNLTIHATICRKTGRSQEALDAVRKAIRQEPDKGYGVGMIGIVTAWQMGRRDEARWWADYVLKHPEGFTGSAKDLRKTVEERLRRLETGGGAKGREFDLP
jgi:hypothetical protein